jgi:hypothetical protein
MTPFTFVAGLILLSTAEGQLLSGAKVRIIERLDQGHLYPLGERRDKHVTGGAQTSAPLHRRRMLYLKSYLDSLYIDYLEPLHGCPSACGITHGLIWRRLVAHM